MSFKLLALRPLDGCNEKLKKNLITNQLYKFYNDYRFFIGENEILGPVKGDINKIEYNSTALEQLYYKGEETYKTKINVSGIVGKNGSGKSALIELMIAAIVKISLDVDEKFIDPDNLYYHSDKLILEEYKQKFLDSKNEDLNNINVEIFYLHRAESIYSTTNEINKIRLLRLKDNIITILDFHKKFNTNSIYLSLDNRFINIKEWKVTDNNENIVSNLSPKEFHFFQDFFYSMMINYSHYGYNTLETGEWLKGVFHKNDSYQLPVVINPYREEGNIDINSEKHLASSRFLVNILQEVGLRKISENKELTHISIEIDGGKFNKWIDLESRDERINNREEEKTEILEILIETFSNEINRRVINNRTEYYPYLRDYILLKLYKITQYKKYEDFRKNKNIIMKNENPDHFTLLVSDNLREYIHDLENDGSHITDKLRQALFLLQYNYLDDNDIFKKSTNEKLLEIDDLFSRIEDKFAASKIHLPATEFLSTQGFTTKQSLPSIFKINYFFENKFSSNNFNNFSSGEKQKIFSIHSVIYHLRNLKSVEQNYNSNDGKKKEFIYYKNVNIVFDEIELYAHPDYQRRFLNDLLNAINSVYQRYDNLNILFITHSPFILSDIPKQNVLFLKDGKPQDFERMNTFGANITDLLSESFFIEDGLIGDFAKEKINNVISWLNDDFRDMQKKEFYKQVIDIIDEPLIKRKLSEMFSVVTNENFELETIQNEIDLLEKRKQYLISKKKI